MDRFAPPDDLGIEDEDDWSLLTDNSKAQTPNWERRSDNDSEQSRKPKQAEQRSIRCARNTKHLHEFVPANPDQQMSVTKETHLGEPA